MKRMNPMAEGEEGAPIRLWNLTDAPAPAYLAPKILAHIARARKRLALRRTALSSGVFLLSIFGFIESVRYFADDLYLTGFTDYFNLLFTNTHVVLTFWREFALMLIQSLPPLPLAAALVLFISMVWSLAKSMRSASALLTRAA